jgi:hypothetical protein
LRSTGPRHFGSWTIASESTKIKLRIPNNQPARNRGLQFIPQSIMLYLVVLRADKRCRGQTHAVKNILKPHALNAPYCSAERALFGPLHLLRSLAVSIPRFICCGSLRSRTRACAPNRFRLFHSSIRSTLRQHSAALGLPHSDGLRPRTLRPSSQLG